MAGALSKVKPMKVMKGLFSSLSSSHDSHVTSQPVMFRNTDVHQSLPTPAVATPTSVSATPTAGVVMTSPPSSVEQGELVSVGSPLSDLSGGWPGSPPSGPVSPSPHTSVSPVSAYTPHPDTATFSNTTLDTRYVILTLI